MYVDADKCLGCGSCVNDCARGAIALVEDVATIDQARCDQCGHCLEVCPEGAMYSISERLPVPSAGMPARPGPREVAQEVAPSLISRIVSGLAPVALDAAVSLVDRWLARRGAAPDIGNMIGSTGGSGVRRRTRRRGRW